MSLWFFQVNSNCCVKRAQWPYTYLTCGLNWVVAVNKELHTEKVFCIINIVSNLLKSHLRSRENSRNLENHLCWWIKIWCGSLFIHYLLSSANRGLFHHLWCRLACRAFYELLHSRWWIFFLFLLDLFLCAIHYFIVYWIIKITSFFHIFEIMITEK